MLFQETFMKILFLMLFQLLSFKVYALPGDHVCSASLIMGEVKVQFPDGGLETVTKETIITEGSIVKTGPRSFVKLVFLDKSLMNLGANTGIKIASFTKNSPGIINLIRGQIRSQVTKDYMEMEDKNKSKLFMVTKTAAMGVRGTDFQVNFEDDAEETALVTFEGLVAMNKLDTDVREREFTPRELDKILERKERVLVKAGELSAVNRESRKIDSPVKLESKSFIDLYKSQVPKEKMFINENKKNNQEHKNADKAQLKPNFDNKKDEPRSLPRTENKQGAKEDSRNSFPEKQNINKDGKSFDKNNKINDDRANSRVQSRKDPRIETRIDEKLEMRQDDRKDDQKDGRKDDRKDDQKDGRKDERKDERKDGRKDDRKDSRKDDRKDNRKEKRDEQKPPKNK